MPLKLNWGLKITLLYSGFVALILTLVFLCMGQDVELVSKNYYLDEIKFQERIDARTNYNLLTEKISVNTSGKSITIHFPNEVSNAKASGEILLYRASDVKADIKTPLAIDASGNQTITNEKILKGNYTVQVSFKMNNKDFYTEETVWFN